MTRMSTPIEEYALIGDTETAALVSRTGSIDWLCLPRFDSAACFAALLGDPANGRWLIGPAGRARSTRSYRGASYVLDTVHETEGGNVRVTDVMPVGDGRADVVRRVEGLAGSVDMVHEWVVRMGYGSILPWVSRTTGPDGEDVLMAVAGPDLLTLRADRLPTASDHVHRDAFTVTEGEVLTFALTWSPSWKGVPAALDGASWLEHSQEVFSRWAEACTYQGPYREAVVRSLLVLRQLTDSERGGIVAAPTTSLPEEPGGSRNWDYRYCWLRDASLTLSALLRSGHVDSTRLWRDWLVRAVAGDPEDIQIMYAVDGGRYLPERELDHLSGYAGSTPVRVGNGAVGQQQADVIGEVMIALAEARRHGLEESPQSWEVQKVLMEHLERTWDEPDNGLWEVRGSRRHFTQSTVMVWAAFDRAVRAVEEHGLDGPVERWRELRDLVHRTVLERGYDPDRNTFTQHDETTEVDASLLMIPLVGFLPGDDPRVLGTITAVEHDLVRDGLVLRYRTDSGVDGLAGGEHPFMACAWWLVSAYAASGQVEKAHDLMGRLLGLLNDVGLISEEYDTLGGRMVGNYPQALSHLALVGAAYALAEADGARGDG